MPTGQDTALHGDNPGRALSGVFSAPITHRPRHGESGSACLWGWGYLGF